MSAYGQHLRKLRQTAGIRQVDLASAMHWSQEKLCRIEQGSRACKVEEWYALQLAINRIKKQMDAAHERALQEAVGTCDKPKQAQEV